MRVWELASGDSRVLSGHVGPVWGVTWIGQDRVASASGDGTVRLWSVPPLPPPNLEQLLRRVAALTDVIVDEHVQPGAPAQPDRAVDDRPPTALSPTA